MDQALELSFGKWFVKVGSIVLVIGHLKNYRHCRQDKGQLRGLRGKPGVFVDEGGIAINLFFKIPNKQ